MKLQTDKINSFIGIPYKLRGRSKKDGLDCYGIIKEFYKECFNIKLSLFSPIENQDPFEKNMVEYNEDANFKSVDIGGSFHKGDLLTFILERPKGDNVIKMFHVGLYLGDGLMLHTKEGTGSSIERFESYSGKRFFSGALRYVNN